MSDVECGNSDSNCDVLHRSEIRIGGLSIRVAGECRNDVALVPSLQAFRANTGVSDVQLRVEWTARLTCLQGRPIFDSGSVWKLYEGDDAFVFDFNAASLGTQPYKRLLVDRQFRTATLQMSAESFAATGGTLAPLEYPLDELLIMHRLTQEKAIELHSCGIVRADGVGNLFVGHSGAGKSTTTRLWTEREDVEVLSDDRIIIRRDPLAFRKIRMYGTPWHGEAMYASPNSAPLARILVLQHGHGNILTRLSPGQAVSELFARSFVPFHRHEYVDSALEFLQEVAETVPVYLYEFEPDQRAADKIRDLND
jgi:hypothetical protein